MRVNNLLPIYFSKNLFKNFIFCLFAAGFFIFIIDLIELSRRITKTNDSDLLLAIELDIEPLLKEAESLEQEVQVVREQAPPEVSSAVPRYIG